MRSSIQRATLLALLLLLPLAPAGADAGGSLKDLATEVESVAREISTTTVLLLAYERLDQGEDAAKAKQKIRELLGRERQALDELERRLDGKPPAPEPAPVAPPVDETLEKIRSYAEAAIPLFQHEFLTSIIRDDRQELRYRQAAAQALCQRFKNLGADPRLEKEKEEIGRALLPKLNDTDVKVRVAVAHVFRQFWPGMYMRSGFDPESANFKERYKAYKMWREYLKK